GGEHSVPFNALTLPQDTGGAIKRNRVDLFCGNGETATHTASYLDNRGAVFLLLPR
ncbi:MAG: transglycosylase, partial [Bilophila sp.]|nr:transglycosylase [Bilophila sp.]